MNIERLTALVEVLKHTKYFNMVEYFKDQPVDLKSVPVNECGTPSCIAGHAIVMYPNSAEYWRDKFGSTDVFENEHYYMGKHVLELSDDEATWLFLGMFRKNGVFAGNIITERAIKAIEHLIAGNSVRDRNGSFVKLKVTLK